MANISEPSLASDKITLSTMQFCFLLLGDEHYVDIPINIAEILHYKFQLFRRVDKIPTFHIQTHDHEGVKLPTVKLWLWSAWANDTERWQTAKEKSRIEYEESCIEKENCRRLAKAIRLMTGITTPDVLQMLAFQTLKNGKHKAFGVTLCTSIKEIN